MKQLSLPRLLLCVLVLTLPALAGCSSDEDKDTYVDRPIDQLYTEATAKMVDGDYKEAAKLFDDVEREHPYSEWANRAQLQAAYAQYRGEDYDEAVVTIDRFIELHPGNENIAYAYYLKALCYYDRITDVERDQTSADLALKTLTEVVKRFPDSVYARDAKFKISLVRNHLAGREMEIGRYYQNHLLYQSAIGRFRTVVEHYQTTTQTPEALERLVECYLALGIPKEAKAVAAVLGYNYPGSDWYADAYKLLGDQGMKPKADKDSWVSKAWNKVF